MTTRNRAGFTLVEMLIVVAILGLLAAVAIPQFTSAKEDGRVAAMVSSLSIMRTAVDSYWSQHDGFPGQKNSTEFTNQLCKTTNKAGKVGTGTGYGYGPYLRRGQLPENPFTGTNTVRVVSKMPSAPSGKEGWIYDKVTGEVRGNVKGTTPDGIKLYVL